MVVCQQSRCFKSASLLIILISLSCCNPSSQVEEIKIEWPTDEWITAAPETVDMDSALIDNMLAEIEESGLNLDGLVVVHQGVIVAEKYYPVYNQQTLHESYSITKSVISALVGIALQQGCIKSLEDPVLDYFPDRDFKNLDDHKKAITIQHLLTMSSGLDWDQDEMVSHPDWVQYTLDQKVIHEPGSTWFYSNGSPHVLSALIQEACEMDTKDFAEKQLFGPLGIEEYRWQKAVDGYPNGGWGLAMTPRDLAKLGYLYLRDGVWEGKQILPMDWVDDSFTAYYQVPDPLEPWELFYGYLWWIHGDGPYAAHGTKGQFVYLIPEKDLVVVVTGNIPDSEFVKPQQLIRDYIIPAVGTIPNNPI